MACFFVAQEWMDPAELDTRDNPWVTWNNAGYRINRPTGVKKGDLRTKGLGISRGTSRARRPRVKRTVGAQYKRT